MTFVYGDPIVRNRGNVCKRLTQMMSINKSNFWFITGGFNENTGNYEKREGSRG